MKNIFVLILATLLTGCAAGYQTSELTDKFSDPTKPVIHAMRGNAIDFADPMGMLQTSELNGFVARDRATGKVKYAGFFFSRVITSEEIGYSGKARWLNIQIGNEAVFLADGERIALKADAPGRMDHKTNRGTGYTISTDYFEDVQYIGTVEQFHKIAYANTLEFKFSGVSGADSFPSKRPLLQSFRANIQRFYESEIAPHR